MKPEVIEPEVIEPEVIEPEVENNSTSPQLEGNPELQLALSQASNLTSLISEAKTTAMRIYLLRSNGVKESPIPENLFIVIKKSKR